MTACAKVHDRQDKKFSLSAAKLLYSGKPYSGHVRDFFPSGKLRSVTVYEDGLKHGYQKIWYENGNIQEIRYFQLGIKTGTHRGWHRNGQVRFLSEFSDGKFTGESYSWYDNGHVASYAVYRGANQLAFKKWRENGKIYINYVRDGNEQVGLYGGRLCIKVSKDRDGSL
jgi:antitoxin component YwqK of YwqJK toxin-antitoxin module